jgi:hypothetical protein
MIGPLVPRGLRETSAGKKITPANADQNIPHFPDISPNAALNDRECRERRECSGHTGEDGRDFQPLALRTRAAPGMSGITGMFSLPVSQTGRLYRPRITPPCWRLEITEGWSLPPTPSRGGDPRSTLRRLRTRRHPAMQFAAAVRQRLKLAWRASPRSRSASRPQAFR